MKSKTQRIAMFRAQYEETDGPANKETWDEYWERMVADKTWVDFWFIQSTAWYLQLDMWIITTSSTENSPYIEISGNLEEGVIPVNRPILILGTKSNCHYQSLIPVEIVFHQDLPDLETSDLHMSNARKKFNEMTAPDSAPARQSDDGCKESGDSMKLDLPVPDLTDGEVTDDEEDEIMCHSESSPAKNTTTAKIPCSQYQPFIYNYKETIIHFARTSNDYYMRCPNCLKESKQIVQHLTKNNSCQNYVNIDSFKQQFKIYKKEKMKEDQNMRKAASRAKQRAKNEDKVKQKQNEWKATSLANQRIQNEDKVKQNQTERKAAFLAKQRAQNEEKVNQKQN